MSFLSNHKAQERGTVDPVTGKPPIDHSTPEPVHPGHQLKQNNSAHVGLDKDPAEAGEKEQAKK